MTNSSKVAHISFGVGILLDDLDLFSLFSSWIISLHSSTHSSQINTVGPAISFFTSCWLLPQNEQ